MDIKTHKNSFDEIQESDRPGWINETIKEPPVIKEAEKEIREAADSKSAASKEDAGNYATEQFTGKTLQLGSVAGSGAKDTVTQLTEIRKRRREKADRKSESKTGAAECSEEPAEKRKSEAAEKSGNTGKIKVKEKNEKAVNLKIKEKNTDLKEGKDIKTGGMEIRTSADVSPDAGEPTPENISENDDMSGMFSYHGKGTGAKKGKDYTQIVTKALKKFAKALIASVAVYVLPVIVVLVIIIAYAAGENNSLNIIGNKAAWIMNEEHEYQENLVNGGVHNLKLTLSVNSTIGKANAKYHEKVQEVIDQYSGSYDVLDYEDIEPDWQLITQVYLAMSYINNDGKYYQGEFEEAAAEEFEELMWNMVSIEHELHPDGEDEIPAEQETESSGESETVTSDGAAQTEPEDKKPITLTIYAKMISVDEVAHLYNIGADELQKVLSMTAMYGNVIEDSLSGLDKFVPAGKNESEEESSTAS